LEGNEKQVPYRKPTHGVCAPPFYGVIINVFVFGLVCLGQKRAAAFNAEEV
jgi:hypothetical protein